MAATRNAAALDSILLPPLNNNHDKAVSITSVSDKLLPEKVASGHHEEFTAVSVSLQQQQQQQQQKLIIKISFHCNSINI